MQWHAHPTIYLYKDCVCWMQWDYVLFLPFFECVGIPCSHQACVITLCYKEEEKVFSGFNDHNVAVRWWSSYMLYTYKETPPDIKGLNLCLQISPLLALEDANDIKSAIVRLKNYPGESILDIAKLNCACLTNAGGGYIWYSVEWSHCWVESC